ncbi:hypothetical protein ACOSQ3_031617 [Xanthoceras sorbifolium]
MNTILRLKDSSDVWIEENDKLDQIIVTYFAQLFSSSQPSQQDLMVVLDMVGQKLSPDSIRFLEARF